MGRELRRVPADWDHPKAQMPWGFDYHPLFDESFEVSCREWIDGAEAWLHGDWITEYSDQPVDYPRTLQAYSEYVGISPDPEYYRPEWPDESRTHFQVYETVSEGTPLSPPLPTTEAVVAWLVENGDRVFGAITREQAEAFVRSAWVPSMMMVGGQVLGGIQASDGGGP